MAQPRPNKDDHALMQHLLRGLRRWHSFVYQWGNRDKAPTEAEMTSRIDHVWQAARAAFLKQHEREDIAGMQALLQEMQQTPEDPRARIGLAQSLRQAAQRIEHGILDHEASKEARTEEEGTEA